MKKLFHPISEDPGSDSSVDDGLPLHLERFAKLRQRKKRKTKAKKVKPQSTIKNLKEMVHFLLLNFAFLIFKFSNVRLFLKTKNH
jgi:hypothetical protein